MSWAYPLRIPRRFQVWGCCGVIKHFKVGGGVRSESDHKGFLININVVKCQFLVVFRKRFFSLFVDTQIHMFVFVKKTTRYRWRLFFDFVFRSSVVRRKSPHRYSATTALNEIANPITYKLLKTTSALVFGRQHPMIQSKGFARFLNLCNCNSGLTQHTPLEC